MDMHDVKDYAEAERLCNEKAAGDIDRQIVQAKKLLLFGNECFWNVLKELFMTVGTWESQRKNLLEELKNSKRFVYYRNVLVEENEKQLLLEAVSEKQMIFFIMDSFL